MKTKYSFILLIIFNLMTNNLTFGQIPSNDPTWGAPKFFDDFNGTVVNSDEWSSQWPWGQKSWEKTCDQTIVPGSTPGICPNQYYSYRTPNFANCTVSNSSVKIVSKQEYYPNALCWEYPNNVPYSYYANFNYTTGMLLSKNYYKYGYFEIMCKLPMPQSPHQTRSLGPNFWLWGGGCGYTDYSEIDVFEFNGEYNNLVNYHTCNSHYRDCYPASGTCPPIGTLWHDDLNTDLGSVNFANNTFHKFAVEWGADRIVYYLDDVPFHLSPNSQYCNDFCPLQIILDINTPATNFCEGMLSPYTVLPYTYEISYVKVWQLKQHCDTDITLCSFNPSTYDYAIYRNITLGGTGCSPTISSGTNVTLRATDGIVLDKGFTVEAGATFLAETTPCQQQEIHKSLNSQQQQPPPDGFELFH